MTIHKTRKNKSAFSLVELLIVVGIMVIISLSIIPSYMDYTQRKDFNNKVEGVAAEVTNVRTKALSGAVVLDGSGNPLDVDWGIERTDCVGNTYSLGYQLVGSSNFVSQFNLTLPTNVTFALGSDGACDTLILFRRLSGAPVLGGGEIEEQIALRYNGSITRTIVINSAGRISYN